MVLDGIQCALFPILTFTFPAPLQCVSSQKPALYGISVCVVLYCCYIVYIYIHIAYEKKYCILCGKLSKNSPLHYKITFSTLYALPSSKLNESEHNNTVDIIDSVNILKLLNIQLCILSSYIECLTISHGLEVANIDVLSTRHFHDCIVVFLLFIIALSLAASSLLSKQFVLN